MAMCRLHVDSKRWKMMYFAANYVSAQCMLKGYHNVIKPTSVLCKSKECHFAYVQNIKEHV